MERYCNTHGCPLRDIYVRRAVVKRIPCVTFGIGFEYSSRHSVRSVVATLAPPVPSSAPDLLLALESHVGRGVSSQSREVTLTRPPDSAATPPGQVPWPALAPPHWH